jgi:large conductance mechanosensitive channel
VFLGKAQRETAVYNFALHNKAPTTTTAHRWEVWSSKSVVRVGRKEDLMGILEEFKKFAMRGNVVDMAVGIIIGGAFGKIVSSLVADVIMPPIGLLVGGVNFSSLVVTLKEASGKVPAVTLNYGKFIQSVFDFIIIAFSIFILIKLMNSLQEKKEEAPAAPEPPPKQEVLLEEIRDILREK